MQRRELKLTCPAVVNINDLRHLARKRLPKVIFDYIDGGAEGEVTLRENLRAFERVTFRPSNGVTFSQAEVGTTVLGQELAMPLLLAPCGMCRLVHPDGEVGAARAAAKAGVGYVLSTVAGHRLEDVAMASSGHLWFQLYLLGGREAPRLALERAYCAGARVLVVTIDTPTAGGRERDIRNRMAQLLKRGMLVKIRFLPQFVAHPKWLAGFLFDDGCLEFPNVTIPGYGPMRVTDTHSALSQSGVSWNDVQWLRDLWPGSIVIKGVLTAEGACRAVDTGCAAVIVSNHGGRQLDGVSASLCALSEVVSAVNGRCEVLMDGGVRRGSDILKALCLGARAVLIGRAYLYGLAVAGEAGVNRALTMLREELQRNLTLLGCSSVSNLSHSYVELHKPPLSADFH